MGPVSGRISSTTLFLRNVLTVCNLCSSMQMLESSYQIAGRKLTPSCGFDWDCVKTSDGENQYRGASSTSLSMNMVNPPPLLLPEYL